MSQQLHLILSQFSILAKYFLRTVPQAYTKQTYQLVIKFCCLFLNKRRFWKEQYRYFIQSPAVFLTKQKAKSCRTTILYINLPEYLNWVSHPILYIKTSFLSPHIFHCLQFWCSETQTPCVKKKQSLISPQFASLLSLA